MQILAATFLAFLLAHFLAEFPLQTESLIEQKRRGALAAYLKHGLVRYLVTSLVAGWVSEIGFRSKTFHLVVLGLVAVQLLLDAGKYFLQRRERIGDTARTFVLDQSIRCGIVGGAAASVASPSFPEIRPFMLWLQSNQTRFIGVLVVYVVVIFGGGHFVRLATKHLWEAKPGIAAEEQEQLKNAGMYIGWLERFLAMTALLLGSPEAVGLILTAKSVVRYPEFKSVRFAEYFLIGTLLSISIAILGGIVLMKLL